MTAALAINCALALLPVLVFLAALARSDVFKLIRMRLIILLILAGAGAAFLSHELGGVLMRELDIGYVEFTRYAGPALEETLKALIIVFLIWAHRVGFAVDAAIAGFAIGAGFALLENIFYLQVIGQNQPAVWVVRGFGTAIMHGGATALFAMIALALTPKMRRGNVLRFLPGLAAAFALHALFNRFLAYPVASTMVMLVGLAAALGYFLSRNRRSIEQVLAADFETHCKLHHDILWGHFGERDVAHLLETLEVPFNREELPRISKYIRLHTKLIIYTEALLRARERGGLVQVDETVVEMLDEFRGVEASIGQAVRFALNRHLRFSRSESFKLHMLTREAELKAPAAAVDRFALGIDELVD